MRSRSTHFNKKETLLLEETSLHILNETSSLFRSSLPAQIARRGKEAAQHADHDTGSDQPQANEQRKRPDRLQGKQVGKQATADHIIKPRITYHGQDAGNDRTDQTDQYTFHHERHLDEVIAGADVAHDRDLFAAGVDRRLDRIGDQISRQHEQQDDEDHPALTDRIQQADQ